MLCVEPPFGSSARQTDKGLVTRSTNARVADETSGATRMRDRLIKIFLPILQPLHLGINQRLRLGNHNEAIWLRQYGRAASAKGCGEQRERSDGQGRVGGDLALVGACRMWRGFARRCQCRTNPGGGFYRAPVRRMS